MTETLKSSHISFRKPRNVVRYNGDILDANSVEPAQLRAFVIDSTDIFQERFERMYQLDIEKSYNDNAPQRSSIILARLAIQGRESSALTFDALRSELNTYSHPKNFKPRTLEYVDALIDTAFTVAVVQRKQPGHLDSNGVWLRIKEQTILR